MIKGQIFALNVQLHDAIKHDASTVLGDALVGLEALATGVEGYHSDASYQDEYSGLKTSWMDDVAAVTAAPGGNALPSDSTVIGAVNRSAPENAIVVGAAGSMPGELHKLWQTGDVDGYHMEYGFSCMGYEVAAGIGVHMAAPDRPNIVFAGDGSYLMMNSELATAVMMGTSMTLVITDNRALAASTGCRPQPVVPPSTIFWLTRIMKCCLISTLSRMPPRLVPAPRRLAQSPSWSPRLPKRFAVMVSMSL